MSDPHYATRAQAQDDARSLPLLETIEAAPAMLLSHLHRVVADPRTSSDTLLIAADAVREAALAMQQLHQHRALLRLADRLAALAPSRVNPIAHVRANPVEP